MKLNYALLLSFSIMVFGSCSQDIEPPVDPPLNNLPGEQKLLEVDYKLLGGSETDFFPLAKFLATANKDDRTVTLWTDTATKKYKRYFYDQQGRLERIVQSDPASTNEGDLNVERPFPDTWKITYIDSSGNKYIKNVVKTTMQEGTQKIVITSVDRPKLRIEEHVDDNNLLRFREITNDTEDINEWIHGRFTYYYDSNRRMTSIVDTSFNKSSKPFTRQVITIAKDNANNAGMTNLLKTMVGTDMQWVLHSVEFRYILPNFYFDFYLSPYTSLQGGSVTGMKKYAEISHDGVNFVPGNNGNYIYDSKYQYDAKGRMTSYRMTEDGFLVRGMSLKYFD